MLSLKIGKKFHRKTFLMRNKKVRFDRPSRFDYLKTLPGTSLLFIKQACSLIFYFYVNYVLGRKRAKIGRDSKIHPTVILRQAERITIGKNCLINHNNVLQAGKGLGSISIGNYVQTGPNVSMFAFNHGMELDGTPMIDQDYLDADIIIDDDVWVGAGSVITAGVRIGKGSIIAAGSVVTRDIDPNVIAGGVPAKKIRER